MTNQKRLPRLHRQPESLPPRRVTARRLLLFFYIGVCRYALTSWLMKLAEGDERTNLDHLQHGYHHGAINRFQLEPNGEFIYFIDDLNTIRLLAEEGYQIPEQVYEWVRNNREKKYAEAARHQDPGQLLFLAHELMVGRFGVGLRLACRHSGGKVELISFEQGSVLYNRVEVPKLSADHSHELPEGKETLPHRPDAMFTLRNAETGTENTFLYEAERGTSSTARFQMKLRSHFHFIVKQDLHKKIYHRDRIRAVLIETPRKLWADHLLKAATHPVVSGEKASPLFWFAPSLCFSKLMDVASGSRIRKLPKFLVMPEVMFGRVWANPADRTACSLLD